MTQFVLTQDSNSVVECDHNNLAQCGKHAGIVEAEIKIKMWQIKCGKWRCDKSKCDKLNVTNQSEGIVDWRLKSKCFFLLFYFCSWLLAAVQDSLLWFVYISLLFCCFSDLDWIWFCDNSGNSPGRPPGPGFPVDEHKNWQLWGRRMRFSFFVIFYSFGCKCLHFFDVLIFIVFFYCAITYLAWWRPC